MTWESERAVRSFVGELPVNDFVAIILICLNTVAPAACDETTAADVLSTGVENELSCVMGWQDVVARSAFAADIGKTAYIKTLCRHRGGKPANPTSLQ
jgi:hypothetical protein